VDRFRRFVRDVEHVKESILRKVRETTDLELRFFETEAPRLAECASALALRFGAGGRLFVMGNGGSACDAAHVAVEFLHPIVEKRRPLPAIALGADVATTTAIGNDTDFARVFVEPLEILARAGDAALGISSSGASANVNRALRRAREIGLLTIGFAGRDGGQMPELCDFPFVVPSWSIHRIQETQTTLLHLLWDCVHVAMGEDDVL
jgi:D-sedoheptulose 7-phosphate isomerase